MNESKFKPYKAEQLPRPRRRACYLWKLSCCLAYYICFSLGFRSDKLEGLSIFIISQAGNAYLYYWQLGQQRQNFSIKTKTMHLFSKAIIKMKVTTEEDTRPVTKTSLFLRFLVKMCFIMIKKSGNDNIKFSNAKLIWYLIGSCGWLASGVIISQVGINDSVVSSYFKVLN